MLDAAIEYANFKKYDGTLPDSSFTSSKLVADVYNTLLMSRLSADAYTPKTSEGFVADWKAAQEKDIIPLGGVFYKFAEFSDATQLNAQNTGDPGTLTVSNGQLYDKYINGEWQNPYQEKYVFAMAPAVTSFDKFNFKIHLPTNLFVTNQSAQIQQIEYKLSDTLPYQILSKDQFINVSYTAEGTYHWTFKITMVGGQVLYSHTQFTVSGNMDLYEDVDASSKSSVLSSYKKHYIDPYIIPFFGQPIVKAKATVYYRLAPGHQQITKPLIIAEGFDMGAVVSPSQEAGLTNIKDLINSLPSGGNLANHLNINSYDIIYVDWNNGVDYIQNNADLFKKAIQWVNSVKVGTEKNVVLGQSMGGLIARYALKDMEDLGLNHDAKLFISHDSPHLGANIPLGLQYMLVNVSRSYIRTPIAGPAEFIVPIFNNGISVNDILSLTDTPAARQMLINYVNKNYQIDNRAHNSWQNTIRSKGFPQQTRNVAISNGSECGTDQTLSDLLRLYKETANQHLFSDVIGALVGVAVGRLDMVLLAALPGSSKYVFDFTVKPMTLVNESKQLYKGNIKYKKKVLWIFNSQVTLLNGAKTQPGNILPYHKYGGGRFILEQDELPNIVKDNLTTTPFGFIPTPSALDFYSGNQLLVEADFQKPYSPVDDAANVPFSNFVVERMGDNNQHVSFSPRNGQFIINQLSTDPTVQNQKITTSYLCGSKIQIGGEALLCGTTQSVYTTGFVPSIQWSVEAGSNLIEINGATNLPQIAITPKPNANGLVVLKASLSGGGESNTVLKNIWIGKPATSVAQINNPNFYNESHFYLIGNLTNQGVTNIKWTKISSNPTARVYLLASENDDSGIARGPNNSWTMNIKVDVTNACGTSTYFSTITPPAATPCDNTYALVKTLQSSNSYSIIPPDPCVQSQSAYSINNMSTSSFNISPPLQIKVANNMGAIVISKNGNSFDLSPFPSGMYVVNVSQNGTTLLSQTLIKN